MLTYLLYISSLLCLIKLKLGMPLRCALCRFVVEFHKNQMTSWWRHFNFLHTNVHISNSIEPTKFIFGTNIQQLEMHLMIKGICNPLKVGHGFVYILGLKISLMILRNCSFSDNLFCSLSISSNGWTEWEKVR